MAKAQLYLGDNLTVLQNEIPSESIDLIYLDPPFYTQRRYDMLKGRDGTGAIQKGVFKDVWRWDETASANLDFLSDHPDQYRKIKAMGEIIGENGLFSYQLFIAVRLQELKRVLTTTGSIYFHCDQHASAYIKILMDIIFGSDNFLNTIVWCYGLGGSSPRYWPRKHDDILWYSKEQNMHIFSPFKIPAVSNKMKGQMKKAPDYWYIPTINNMAKERNNYPTQKPEHLMERIIESSSLSSQTVLDPFCGSGTTIAVAQRLGRNAIGIDSNPEAIAIAKKRIEG